jgi:hypothetical protein
MPSPPEKAPECIPANVSYVGCPNALDTPAMGQGETASILQEIIENWVENWRRESNTQGLMWLQPAAPDYNYAPPTETYATPHYSLGFPTDYHSTDLVWARDLPQDSVRTTMGVSGDSPSASTSLVLEHDYSLAGAHLAEMPLWHNYNEFRPYTETDSVLQMLDRGLISQQTALDIMGLGETHIPEKEPAQTDLERLLNGQDPLGGKSWFS